MANMVSYKRVSGDIAEAERIARLLQEEFDKDLDKLKTDFKEMHARGSIVAKWNEIAEDLKTAIAGPREPAPVKPPKKPETKPPAV